MAKKAAEKRGRGRPAVPAEERKSAHLILRISEADRALLDEVSEGNTSAWARDVLLKAAKRLRKPQ
jgi:hypothetical protein